MLNSKTWLGGCWTRRLFFTDLGVGEGLPRLFFTNLISTCLLFARARRHPQAPDVVVRLPGHNVSVTGLASADLSLEARIDEAVGERYISTATSLPFPPFLSTGRRCQHGSKHAAGCTVVGHQQHGRCCQHQHRQYCLAVAGTGKYWRQLGYRQHLCRRSQHGADGCPQRAQHSHVGCRDQSG